MSNFQSYLPGNPKLFRLLALGIAFCLPVTKHGVPLLIAMLVLLRLWQYFIGEKGSVKASRALKIFGILCISYYLLHIVGMAWTEDLASGWDELEYKLSFLVIPLLFVFRVPYKDKFLPLVSLSYVGGAVCFMAYALIRAGLRYEDEGITVWFYSQLSSYFHPSYMALYACWAAILSIQLYKEYNRFNFIFWISALLMLFFVVLLASKAGFFAAIITVFLAAVYLLRISFKSYTNWLVIGSCLAILALGSAYSPSLNQRLVAATESVKQNDSAEPLIAAADSIQKPDSQGSTSLRLIAMRAGFSYFISHPFGAGTGDLDVAMMEEYQKLNATESIEKKLNPHNQYLSTGVALGWPGMLLLLGILIFPMWYFFRRGRLVHFALPLILAFNLVFESMLEVQGGIVFFVFWITILLAEPEQSEQINNQS